MRGLVLAAGLALAAVPAGADPPKKLTDEERKALRATWRETTVAGLQAHRAGKADDAAKAFEAALDLARRLYPKDEYPDGHPDLATSLNNLAGVRRDRGRPADAEALYRDALAMTRRLVDGDHSAVAVGLNNLGFLYFVQGKLADAEPLLADALAMRRRLHKGDHPDTALALSNLGLLRQAQGRLADAEPLLADALGMRRRLFPGDHPDLAVALNNVGDLHRRRGRPADAEPLLADALAMTRRLYKGDHPAVGLGLNNLGNLYQAVGRLADAERLYQEAVAMTRRVHKGDHPDLVLGMYNLALAHRVQGRLADAEPLFADALAMSRRLHPGDHPDTAFGLSNLAVLRHAQGRPGDAAPLFADALAMRRRLYKGDHPDVANSLNNLAAVYRELGRPGEAEPLLGEALGMRRRLHPGDHPDTATSLSNLATARQDLGRPGEAEPLTREALGMWGRLVAGYAGRAAEGEALTFLASLPLARDAYLSAARAAGAGPDRAYPEVWASKGQLARVYEGRHQAARAATDPAAARLLAGLTAARRRRAELLLAPRPGDAATRAQREGDLRDLDEAIAGQAAAVGRLLPAVPRAGRVAAAAPADLQQVLPAGAAVADFLRWTLIEYDPAKPGKAGERWTDRYLAFVLTRDAVAWVDLGPADPVEQAVAAWRAAITVGAPVPADLSAKVRDLVWAKVRKELPAGTTTVYVSPDAALCGVPWAALPGDKPGTVLLEDFALATIPHAPFLLDKLLPPDPVTNPPAAALVVGGVRYDADPPPFWAAAAGAVRAAGSRLIRDAAPPGFWAAAALALGPTRSGAGEWPYLKETAPEADGVAAAAKRKGLNPAVLTGAAATTDAVLAELPKARVAHFATHGFFADPSFRSVFQLSERDYEMSRRGERIGRAANSPLVMTGLVLAGANRPEAPGRGIVTGEALVDLDLSGLELAVLSACETGLGDVAGGEGVFGLQRAFHLAGARDVAASLWKVDDAATAALMGEFYRNLWDKNLPPIEALRQAQLAVMRADGKAFAALARGFEAGTKDLTGVPVLADPADPKSGNHPRLWAAFTLSGPGR
jgi:CHAT domain-containing protein/tetratricopeptide (TPR) repeat protein